MGIKFYYHFQSPASQMVWMVLKALGIEYEAVIVDFTKGETQTEEYKKINPYQQIPTIIDEDFTIAESRAIAIYLCTNYEKKEKMQKLYPTDPREQAMFNMKMFRDIDHYNTILYYLDIDDVFEGKSDGPAVKWFSHVIKILQEYESILSKQQYIFGDHLTLLDFSVICTINALVPCGYDIWGKYPNLAKWKQRLAELPYYKECQEDGTRLTTEMYLSVCKQGLPKN